MMDPILINKIIVATIDIFGLWIAFWVLFADRGSRVNRLFFFFTVCILLWITFGFFGAFSKNEQTSLLFFKLNWGAISLLFIFAYFFSMYFPRESKRPWILDKIVIIVCLVLFYFSIFTSFVHRDVIISEGGNINIFGPGIYIFYLAVVTFAILTLSQLFRKYSVSPEYDRFKIKYLLIGLSLAAFFNIFFNVALPLFQGTSRYYQFGDYSVVLIFGFTAYAILKRQLFGIKTILTTFVLGLTVILITLDIFLLTQEPSFWAIKISILFPMFYFIYLLFRSVNKEIKQREEVEKINKGIKMYTEEILRERNFLRKDLWEKVNKLQERLRELEDQLGL